MREDFAEAVIFKHEYGLKLAGKLLGMREEYSKLRDQHLVSPKTGICSSKYNMAGVIETLRVMLECQMIFVTHLLEP